MHRTMPHNRNNWGQSLFKYASPKQQSLNGDVQVQLVFGPVGEMPEARPTPDAASYSAGLRFLGRPRGLGASGRAVRWPSASR